MEAYIVIYIILTDFREVKDYWMHFSSSFEKSINNWTKPFLYILEIFDEVLNLQLILINYLPDEVYTVCKNVMS